MSKKYSPPNGFTVDPSNARLFTVSTENFQGEIGIMGMCIGILFAGLGWISIFPEALYIFNTLFMYGQLTIIDFNIYFSKLLN